ncbi:MAG TPA: aspartate-semialdehyde dehydrogenase [Planctomycetes bacterium]|nr:aspartate-semialdehyde dehydrogenase [Planctomycetota bacterium]
MSSVPEKPVLAIAGATGAVGGEILRLLEEGALPFADLRLLASRRSVGREIELGGETYLVEELREEAFEGVDLALFSCGGERSLHFAPKATQRGCVVVDNSSAFRMREDVPLVVPEVNPQALWNEAGGLRSMLIANPNCSTILLVLALSPLARAVGLRRVVVSTYQAASGAGAKAMEALQRDLGAGTGQGGHYRGKAWEGLFPHPLAGNLIPQIDRFLPGGSTKEEWKMVVESQKILGLPDLRLDVTCVRVPILRSHSEAVTVETRSPLSAEEARELFAGSEGLLVVDQPEELMYPMPLQATGIQEVLVGRVRESGVFDSGISFFLSGDQLLKGAAWNAVQIAALLCRAGEEAGEGGKESNETNAAKAERGPAEEREA